MGILELPFTLLRVPNVKLKIPRFLDYVSSTLVLALIYFSYFLTSSGIIYDLIVEPPSMGFTKDPTTGALKPEVFLKYRINGQYIIEGLSAGFLFCIGGAGIILLDRAALKAQTERNRYILIMLGVLLIAIAYNVTTLFLRIKFPGYLQS